MCKKKDKIEHHYDNVGCICNKSEGTLYWRNIWGFVKGDARWACNDSRMMGIRVQDIVVKCKNKSTCYDLLDRMSDGSIARYLSDHPEKFKIMNPNDGAYHIFHTELADGPYTKSFHINLKADYYAEEI